MHPYQYQPLEYSNSIRILVLHPSSNQSDSVSCTIRHRRLSDTSLNYEALSYTWGDATQKRAIYLDDSSGELLVTENCHNALRRLRYTHEERLLWVDAICINQEDLEERASQVCLMNVIFELASNVMVFLGEPNSRNRVLLEELGASYEMSRAERCNRPPPSEVVIQQLEELFQNSWFKRVWVLQEVCDKDPVTFMCGSTCFSDTDLRDLYMGYGEAVVTKVFWPLATQWIFKPPEEFSTLQFSLWNRLGESRDYLATDPRDRVFALKSLLGPDQSQIDHLINYDQSVEECFTQVALFLLPVLGLRLLTAARHPHKKNMPSWIPDWSQTLPLQYWNFHMDSLESSLIPIPYVGRFHEQGYALWSFSGRSNDTVRELHVTGCRYAQILKISQVFQFNSGEDARKQMERLYYSLVNLRPFVDTESQTCDDAAMYLPLDEAILQIMASMSGHKLDLHLRRGFNSGFEIDANFSDAYFMRDLFASLQQCRIGLMDNKQLVIVPEAVQVGDVICMLSGAVSPCAIRPSSNGSWRLISGDCYIFTDDFRADEEPEFFMCNKYIIQNRDIAEKFVLR